MPGKALLLLACGLAALSGCLTPEMGDRVDQALGLTPRWPAPRHRPKTTFDDDAALPERIWYGDPLAQVYHERRTNTFIVPDPVHKGWMAVPPDEVGDHGFHPERARFLPDGPPAEVAKVLDFITATEPCWRGGP
ncbi:MAG TPA: hypothetical protein VFF73_41465 [Planctomycetota bacterium]|nr:hypothetical protein [Planctomycetota bacterium]